MVDGLNGIQLLQTVTVMDHFTFFCQHFFDWRSRLALISAFVLWPFRKNHCECVLDGMACFKQ